MSRTAAILDADWPAPPRVRAFTTLRHGAGASVAPFDTFNLGSRCGDDADVVASNRAELAERFALPSPPRWLRQVHGMGVVRLAGFPGAAQPGSDSVDRPAEDGAVAGSARVDGEPEADAALTSAPGVVLAILTADCLPVVFAAKDGSEVAAAHAGWRGLVAGVLEATVAAMRAPPQDLVAWLGPAAGPLAYEVGQEVRDAFVARDTQAEAAFVATRAGHWHVDLYALARMRLLAAGIAAGNIYGGGLCTLSDPQRFYSHRRSTTDSGGRTGRMATLAWIEP